MKNRHTLGSPSTSVGASPARDNAACRAERFSTAHPQVALQIDNLTNQEADFHQALAATATGTVAEITGPEKPGWQELFLTKHPYLQDFVASPTCALLKITVETYFVVNRFQNVRELHLQP